MVGARESALADLDEEVVDPARLVLVGRGALDREDEAPQVGSDVATDAFDVLEAVVTERFARAVDVGLGRLRVRDDGPRFGRGVDAVFAFWRRRSSLTIRALHRSTTRSRVHRRK